MSISNAPKTTAAFRPYARSAAFHQTYRPHSGLGRLVNRRSMIPDRPTTPLLIGGAGDLIPQNLAKRENNYLFDVGGIPSYLFEHHSSSTYAVMEGREFGVIRDGSVLFHFDAHPDAECCHSFLKTPTNIYLMFNNHFHEAEWIWPLADRGVISEVVWFSSSPGKMFINGDFQQFRKNFPAVKVSEVPERELAAFDRSRIDRLPRQKIVLSIDYDYFTYPQIEYLFESTSLIQYIYRRAGLVTQALSPAYIDISKAVQLACGLMNSIWLDRPAGRQSRQNSC